MGDVNDAILIAEATPLFPPRPDAIVTMLTSDDFLPGAQTLLYSVKVHGPNDPDNNGPSLGI